jgi:NAD(P)-dependent dehydrogenase (short-subunit alcohol dehydrogenase family)
VTDSSVQPKVAVITGAGRGIGAACARGFATAGYAVVIAEQNAASGSSLAAELTSAGFKALFVQTDITLEADIEQLIAEVLQHFGRVDVLVNNAGRNERTPLLETSTATWLGLLTLNLSSVFWACRAAMPHLIKTGGCIVNVSSLVGLQGQREAVAYSAAKGGVIALTKTLALDFAPLGVRVNCVCPGDIRTPLYDEWLSEQPDPTETLEAITARLPVGRMGTAEETANAVLFLAQNGFANGSVLTLDGGKSLG